jgi:hypothetical protein
MVWICAGVQPLNSRIRCTLLAKKVGNCSGWGAVARYAFLKSSGMSSSFA